MTTMDPHDRIDMTGLFIADMFREPLQRFQLT